MSGTCYSTYLTKKKSHFCLTGGQQEGDIFERSFHDFNRSLG